MATNKINDISVLLKMYEVNRNAIMSRVSYRDYCLMLYIGAAVGILSAAISRNNFDIIFGIPVLSLGATLIICHHHYMINVHSRYIVEKINPLIRGTYEIELFDLHPKAVTGIDLGLRFIGELIFLILPSFIILYFVKEGFLKDSGGIYVYLTSAIGLKLFTFILTYRNRFNHNAYVKLETLKNSLRQ